MNQSDCDGIAQAIVFSKSRDEMDERLTAMDPRIPELVEGYEEVAGTDEATMARYDELLAEDGGVFKKRSSERKKQLYDQAYKEVRA